VGYFCPIGGSAHPDSGSHPLDRHLRLVHDAFELCSDVKTMFGVAEDEAVKLLAMGKRAELIDRIYASYAAYKDMHDVVLVQGTSIGTGKLDAEIAGVLNAPAIIACQVRIC
jgi:BioD-like phosphotransacetylase family protein